MNADAVLNFKFDSMSRRITELEMTQSENTAKSERSGVAFTARIYATIADAPLAIDGNTDYALGFIRSARKSGEGAGVGTGLLAYYNPATDSWLRVSDDGAVTE